MAADVAWVKMRRHVAAYVHATWRTHMHVRVCVCICARMRARVYVCAYVNQIEIVDLHLSEGVLGAL